MKALKRWENKTFDLSGLHQTAHAFGFVPSRPVLLLPPPDPTRHSTLPSPPLPVTQSPLHRLRISIPSLPPASHSHSHRLPHPTPIPSPPYGRRRNPSSRRRRRATSLSLFCHGELREEGAPVPRRAWPRAAEPRVLRLRRLGRLGPRRHVHQPDEQPGASPPTRSARF